MSASTFAARFVAHAAACVNPCSLAITVRRSTGTAFSGNEAWTLNPYYGTRGTFFADVTGDGRADAIVVNDDRVTVRRSA